MKEFEYLLAEGESFITEAELAALRGRSDFVDLSELHEERNQAVLEEYGEASRQLEIRPFSNRLDLGAQGATTLQTGPSSVRMMLNALFEKPNSILPAVTFCRVTGGQASTPVAGFNYRFSGEAVIVSEKRDFRSFLHLAPDLQIVQVPTNRLIRGELPVVSDAAPEIPEHKGLTPEQMAKADAARPIFDYPRLIEEHNPEHFAKMVNAELMNYRTEQLAAQINQTRPPEKQLMPQSIIFHGNERVEINGHIYPPGPMPTRLLHHLMASYLEGWVDVAGLGSFDHVREIAALQTVLHALFTQGSILVKGKSAIESAMLKPSLFYYE
jgi:hypothetical protein